MIPAFLLPVLGSRAGQIAIAAVVAGAVGFGSGYRVADQAAEVARLRVTVEALERKAALEEVGREVADARAKRAEAEAKTAREKLRAIEEWTDDQDNPVGDGLRDVLRGLRQP